MAVHSVHPGREDAFDDFYAMPISGIVLPKYRMPDEESAPRAVRSVVHDELALDGNSSQNLATFCTTWVESEVEASWMSASTRT